MGSCIASRGSRRGPRRAFCYFLVQSRCESYGGYGFCSYAGSDISVRAPLLPFSLPLRGVGFQLGEHLRAVLPFQLDPPLGCVFFGVAASVNEEALASERGRRVLPVVRLAAILEEAANT